MITVTEKGRQKLIELLEENKAKYVRIFALSREHSAYDLGLEFETKRGDVIIEAAGIQFVADDMSKDYLRGLRIDYDDSDDEPGFLATSSCNSSCSSCTSQCDL